MASRITMHILQITPQLPYPPDSGGRVALYDLLRHLSRRHTVTLASFVTEETERHTADLQPYCDRIIAVRHAPASSGWAMARHLLSSQPYTMTRFYADAMMSEIRRITRSGGIDLAHIDHLHMAQYIEVLPAALPAVLREHNVESTIMRRFAAQSSNPLIRGYAGLQARRLWRYEGRMVGRFDRCIAVTGVDGRTLRQMAPSARVEVVPDGVDTGHFRPDALPVLPEPARIVTTGDYGWPPTADGLIFFVKEIYPLIRRAMPEAAFSVVGRQPPASVRQAASARRIDVLGRVEDVRAEVLRGRVFVVPTRIGSGIRLKILEAMALGRPVVSTSIGCEGIEAAHDEHLLIADDPGAFAGYVVRLLRDPALCDRLITAASRLVRERYAWPALADRLSEIYEAVLRERRETG